MNKNIEYKNIIAFHPGSYVEDYVDEMNISQKDFAKRLNTTEKTLSKLINGETNLTKDLALKLSKMTGISYDTWRNLQIKYENQIIEIEKSKDVEAEKEVSKNIDFNYFKDNFLIENKRYNAEQKVVELRKLLRFANLTNLLDFNPAVSYRNPSKKFNEKNIVNSNIMLTLAENMARDETDNTLDKKLLKKKLKIFREMTNKDSKDLYSELREELLECGIVFVVLPNLKNSSLNGACKQFLNDSVMLMLTDRNKYSDIFWFSFFHEIGHILNGDLNKVVKTEDEYNIKESKADEFARELLIPTEDLEKFCKGQITKENIEKFANEQGIAPGILIGRLQNDGYIERSKFNYLR